MLPIPTHISFANFKSLSEDIKGKKLFKLGNHVLVPFIGACKVPWLGLIEMWLVLFTSSPGTTHLDLKPIEFIRGLSIVGSSSDTSEWD